MKPFHQFSPNELRLLQIFCTVIDCGGYTPALYELNISPSTLSQQITDLEHRLNLRLCDRGRSGFKVTDSGHQVYDEAQKLFAAINQFTTAVHFKTGELSGDLTIAVLDNTLNSPNCFIPQAISKFMDRPGDVNLYIWVRSPLEVQVGVQDGHYDIGIGSDLNHIKGTHYQRLYKEQDYIYCSSEHPFYDRDDELLSEEELHKWPTVKPVFAQTSQSPLNDSEGTNSVGYNLESQAMLILSGKFVGTLPSFYAKQWVETNRIRALRPEVYVSNLEVGVITRSKTESQPLVSAFVEDVLSVHSEGNESSES